MIEIVIALLVVGLVLYLINTLPLDPTIKNIIHVVVVVCVIIWLLQNFGFVNYHTHGIIVQ